MRETTPGKRTSPRIGIFDHVSLRVGGSQLVVANMAESLSRNYSVDLIHSGMGYTLAGLAEAFEVDLSHVHERIVKNSLNTFSPPGLKVNLLRRSFQFDRELTEPYDLFIYSGHGTPPICSGRRGIVYCHFPFERHPSHDLPRTLGWEGRNALDRRMRLFGYTRLWNWRMRGYQTVLANSEFTSGWIKNLWRMPSEVLYPPVATKDVALTKKNIIVSLGRFIAHDSKNHALQLRAFREFLSANKDDWRLCLIGFCTNLPEDIAYLQKLRAESRDIPVTFVVNASRQSLWNWLAEAKMYWHVTALGDDGTCPPERMEHFGISTVEAMGAGCVPFVPTSGGQPEIVRHGVNGFLCETPKSLLHYTSHLAGNETLFQQMSRAARERSQAFRPDYFRQRLNQLAAEALHDESGKGYSTSEASRSCLAHDR
jgi:glycosyltransferase involved in cell wall biosynthesis